MNKWHFPSLPVTKNTSKVCLFLLAALLLSMSIQAQSRKELERQRSQKEKEIALTKKLLAQKDAQQKQTLAYLNGLNQQIARRGELIQNYENDIQLLSKAIGQQNERISKLEAEIEAIRKEYSRLVYHTYKYRSNYRMIGFVFSANSFRQAWYRLRFVRFYSDWRQKQVKLIRQNQESLSEKLQQLQQEQEEKAKLLAELSDQKKAYEQDKDEKARIIKKLERDEKKLKRDLAAKEKKAKQLDRAIKNAIEHEMARVNKSSGSTQNKTSTKVPTLTPEAAKLSAGFAGNQRKLPWPVERGIITGHFGVHPHPTLRNIQVENKGVRIRTTEGAKARAIFEGEVTSIVKIPGAGNMVLVKHGEYYTVYGYLTDILVSPGDKVSVKQPLGTIVRDAESGTTELELQIWKQSHKLNPELWLSRN